MVVSMIKKERCELLNSTLIPSGNDSNCSDIFKYNAEINFPNKGIVTLTGDVIHTICNSIDIHITPSIDIECSSYFNLLLASYSHGKISINLIDIPKELRRHGLGTIFFDEFFKIFHEMSQKYNFALCEMHITIGEGSTFDRKSSIPFYSRLNGYSFKNIFTVELLELNKKFGFADYVIHYL